MGSLKILKIPVLICFPKYDLHKIMKSWAREIAKSVKCQAQRCTVKSPILQRQREEKPLGFLASQSAFHSGFHMEQKHFL